MEIKKELWKLSEKLGIEGRSDTINGQLNIINRALDSDAGSDIAEGVKNYTKTVTAVEKPDGVTLTGIDPTKTVFDLLISDINKDITVGNDGIISGEVKYVDEGSHAEYWGPGYFLGLQLSNIDASDTSVLVGLEPSYGTGLVEIIEDPDLNGLFKIHDIYKQKVKIVTSDGTRKTTQLFSLVGLKLVNELSE